MTEKLNKQKKIELEIREMELNDLAQVLKKKKKLFTAEKWPNLYRTWDEYELVNAFASDGEFSLVATMDGRIVGFVLGSLIEKRNSSWIYGYLKWIGVNPEVKRAGIGTQLYDRLVEIFIENGARLLLVDTEATNSEAIQFFKKKSFGREKKHIFMSRNLSTHPEYQKRKKYLNRSKHI